MVIFIYLFNQCIHLMKQKIFLLIHLMVFCFTDFASKHALLANGSEYVHYAGEFHPRPKYGWNRYDDEWELVFDNASGSYNPNAELLINLIKLWVFNFPG